jgi:hypothetical protein
MINFSELCIERPLGTKGNNTVNNLLHNAFHKLGYSIIDLPFDCTVWQSENSFVEQRGKKPVIFSSPFSKKIKGSDKQL